MKKIISVGVGLCLVLMIMAFVPTASALPAGTITVTDASAFLPLTGDGDGGHVNNTQLLGSWMDVGEINLIRSGNEGTCTQVTLTFEGTEAVPANDVVEVRVWEDYNADGQADPAGTSGFGHWDDAAPANEVIITGLDLNVDAITGNNLIIKFLISGAAGVDNYVGVVIPDTTEFLCSGTPVNFANIDVGDVPEPHVGGYESQIQGAAPEFASILVPVAATMAIMGFAGFKHYRKKDE